LQANLAGRDPGFLCLQTDEAEEHGLTHPILNFAAKLNSKLALNPKFVVEKEGRYFLLNKDLKGMVREDFYYAGMYLGKTKKGKFFPSFNLLAMLAETKANNVVVAEKAAWLFICGRDIFGEGIRVAHGSRRKGDFTLILNMYDECLGFGRIANDLSSKNVDLAVKNVSDVGDFLRRER
jgi:ribosome biogenesis protein Nip4